MKRNTSPATKSDILHLDKKIDGVEKRLDKKIDDMEKVLRQEIKITVQESKEEMKMEMSKWGSKILNTVDKFLKEILNSRQEREVVSKQLSEHEDRINRLEKHVFVT